MKVKTLIKYLKAEESKLLKILHKELLKRDYTVVTNPDEEYLYAIPRSETLLPVMLLAHVDTVHRNPPEVVFFDSNYRVLWSPEGLGADDRAGVYAIMEIIRNHPVAVLFTTGEESGGKGAKAFIKDFPDNPENYKMLLQLDRRGSNDCVFYRNEAEDFHKYVEEFGFKKATGSFSDIAVVGPAWKVNSANLSIGYVDEHRSTEHFFIDIMLSTVSKIEEMLRQDIPLFEYKERKYVTYTNTGNKDWGGYTGSNTDYKSRYSCTTCGKYVKYADEVYVNGLLYCDSCSYTAGSSAFDCTVCEKPTNLENEVWVDDKDLLCIDCFITHEGFMCDGCEINVLPAGLAHEAAGELGVCDECYESFFLDHEDDVDKQEEKK